MKPSQVVLILAFVFFVLCPIPVWAQTVQEEELTLGVPVAGNLSGTGDVNYYQVTVAAGRHLLVVLDGTNKYGTYDLYIKFGSLPSTADYEDKGDLPNADQWVEIASTQAGTYYIMVHSAYGGGDYSLAAHTHDTFPTLTLGTAASGSLQDTTDVKYYQVTVAAGQHLLVVLDGTNKYGTYDLYIKFGSLPSTADYEDKGDLPNADQGVEIASTQAGTYYIMVHSAYGGGDYIVTAHSQDTFPTLTLGTAASGSLQDSTDVNYYQVTVAAGRHLLVVLDGTNKYGTYDLYIKYGSLPSTADYEDKGDLPNADQGVEIASTQAGTYYIMVHSAYGGGDYSLAAHTQDTFPTLTLGTAASGSLQDSTDVKYYQVTVAAGQHLLVVLDGTNKYGTYDLYIKYGSLPNTADYEDKGDLPNADQGVEIASTQAGTYYIMVRSAYGGGDYGLAAHTQDTFPTLTLGTAASGSLQDSTDVKYYQVTVAAGQHLLVVLDGTNKYGTYDLYIKYGSLPNTADYEDKGDLPNADQGVEIASTQAGTYYIMVRSAYGGGDYSLAAHTQDTFPTLTLGTAASGSLQDSTDVKYYQVTVTAGESLFVILDGESKYNSYDLYIKYGSLPNTVDYEAKGDSSGVDQTVVIPSAQAGFYYIMVHSTYGGGTYTIRAQCPMAIPIGVTLQRQMIGAGREDFVVTTSGDENLVIEVQPTFPITAPLLLLERLGRLPLDGPDDADMWTDVLHDGVYRLLIPRAIAGKYFLSVINETPAAVLNYELRVLAMTNHLYEVWPAVAVPAPTVLGARGIFFSGPLPIALCTTGNPTVATGTLEPLSLSEGRINLDLTGVAPGQYNLYVTWPDGTPQTVANAVEIRAGTGQLTARLETPPATRVGREYVAWLTYANTGSAPLPAPLFIVGSDQATVRLFADGVYTDTVRVMGLAPDIPFDVLPAGAEQRVPITFRVTGTAPVLKLTTIQTGNTHPFPWSSIEPLFGPDPVPSDWAQRWASATTFLGLTWGDVIQATNTLGGVLTMAPVPPSFDTQLAFRLTIALSDTEALTQQPAAQPADVSTIPPEQDFVCPNYLMGLMGYLFSPRFTKNATEDLALFGSDASTFLDRTDIPTFLIAHGNNDDADDTPNPDGTLPFTDLENSIRLKMSLLGEGPVNVVRVNWASGAAGINPWAKTYCRNRAGRNIIEEVGKTLADKIRNELLEAGPELGEQKRQALCQNLILYGHSFGNGVNYEFARNLCPDIKPRAMLLNPASASSGLRRDYGQAFDEGNSFGVHTPVWFDEKKIGVPAQLLCDTPNALWDAFGAHGYGLKWAPDAMSRCMNPSQPKNGANFVSTDCRAPAGLGSEPRTGIPTLYPVTVVVSIDPNLKVAWSTRAKAGELVRYTIYFENMSTATAPAQDVFVEDLLDPRFDWSSVRFVEAGFGDQIIPLPTATFYESIEHSVTIADYRPEITNTWTVNLQAMLDRSSGQLHWTFRTLDPATGLPPDDPLAGFLPPNDSSGRGEGHVTFVVRVRGDTPVHTSIANMATIVFDGGSPISTPATTVTVRPPYQVCLPLIRR